MKDTLNEIKTNLQGNNSKVDEAENQINVWNIRKENKQTIRTARRKKLKKNKNSVGSLWDNFKQPNNHIIGMPEGEETEQEFGNLFEKVMKENFPNLVNEIDRQVQKA